MKKYLLLSTLLFAQVMQAKTIVVKPHGQIPHSKTEVFAGDYSDTLTIVPASDATVLQITVKDLEGNTLTDEVLPADVNQTLNLTIPNSSSGSLLEIKDDKQLMYTAVE